MKDKVGFIDEYGDKSIEFDKEGVSTHFIVTAVIVDRDKIVDINAKIDELRTKYRNGAELKSNKIKDKNFQKRLDLLKEISELDINIYSIVVDKRRIYQESGLQYRSSFFKYVNNLLDSELYFYFPYLELVADEHGDEKFMSGFIEYVEKNHFQTDLFRKPSFRFGDSENENLIQVADIIAGSLARYYDPKKMIEGKDEIIEILKEKTLQHRIWPDAPKQKMRSVADEDGVYNHRISDFAKNLFSKYIEKNEPLAYEGIQHDRAICLKYLMSRFEMNPFEFVYTDEIINVLKSSGGTIKSKQIFRGEIIAHFRDEGLLIVSGQNGYKIPSTKSDLISFFNRYNHLIRPMLLRLEKTNVLIKAATDNEWDMFKYEEFIDLEEMIKIINGG